MVANDMVVSIEFDHSDSTFTNGDTIHGKIVLYNPSTITVSRLTVALTGQSVLSLTDADGLLGNWKQQEKHRVWHRSRQPGEKLLTTLTVHTRVTSHRPSSVPGRRAARKHKARSWIS
jgi:hypothetical protein